MNKDTRAGIEDFVCQLRDISGVLLVGSAAYGMEKSTSDIDLIVISDNLESTISSAILEHMDIASGMKNPAARLRQSCDAHCFKGVVGGRLFSPSIYSPEAFQRITAVENGDLKYTRNTANGGKELLLYNFSGHVSRQKIINQQLNSGHFFAWEPIACHNGTTYFGPVTDALLKSPVLCLDKNGWLVAEIKKFWNGVSRILVSEAANPAELRETGRLPIIRNGDLPQKVYDYIREKLGEVETKN